jgi:hypothetical protein
MAPNESHYVATMGAGQRSGEPRPTTHGVVTLAAGKTSMSAPSVHRSSYNFVKLMAGITNESYSSDARFDHVAHACDVGRQRPCSHPSAALLPYVMKSNSGALGECADRNDAGKTCHIDRHRS